jgi:hypothetical protein
MKRARLALAFLSCIGILAGFTSCKSERKITEQQPTMSTIVPLPKGLKGLAGAYTDSRYLSDLEFGQHSHWLQPWRSFLETVPAKQFLDGVGIGFPTFDEIEPDLVAQMLSKNGFRNVRVEIGWGQINFADESKLNPEQRLTQVLEACQRWNLRPLILLNVHSGAPTPVEMFDRLVTQDTPQGATQISLESTEGLVVGRSGLSDLTEYWAAEALITGINGNTATLSKPLPKAVSAGTRLRMATLKYRPFSKPGGADYKQTLEGWKRYVGTVSRFVARKLGTAGTASLGFDLEIYNELTFGNHFLYLNDYYEPDLDVYEAESIWNHLIEETAAYITQNPSDFAGVGLSNGFSNTIPWTASSRQPERINAINKHPYAGVKRFPADEQNGIKLDQNGLPITEVPNYTSLFPEYYGTGIQTETLLRDSAPFNTNIYDTVHGRYGLRKDKPINVWITEVNIQPLEVEVKDLAAARALKAKTTARYLSFFLNKGVTKLQLYSAIDSQGTDAGLSILQENFIKYAKKGSVYPTDDSPYTAPALQITRRITDLFKQELDPLLNQTRPLEVRSVRDNHDEAQFAAVGNQPPLYNREVFTVLPYQVNKKRFVIGYYVMTRDVRQNLEPKEYTLELAGLDAVGAQLSVYDPFTDASVPLKLHTLEANKLVVTLSATDYPRFLVVEEK